jgi:hypothetical protein
MFGSKLKMNAEEFRTARAEYARLPIPQLIELLASESLRVRFLAEMALRDATST